MTSADSVIIFDSDWNPQVDVQAIDRAHRIGQKRPVSVYRFISQDTIEEKIIERQKIKMKWDNLLLLRGKLNQLNQQKLTKRELEKFAKFGVSKIFKSDGGTFEDEDIDVLIRRGRQRNIDLDNKVS